MFTPDERGSLRAALLEFAQRDSRIVGGAITGSASVGCEDEWSDIDLAFGVSEGVDLHEVLDSFEAILGASARVLAHLDVPSGAWIYRVFLLGNGLQVDVAVTPAADFGARAQTFRHVFGEKGREQFAPSPQPGHLIGWGWLYALHVRSALARGMQWQAEFMLGGLRNQIVALACLRQGLPAREGRGADRLPAEWRTRCERTLAGSVDPGDLRRAFGAGVELLLQEVGFIDPELRDGLAPIILELTA